MYLTRQNLLFFILYSYSSPQGPLVLLLYCTAFDPSTLPSAASFPCPQYFPPYTFPLLLSFPDQTLTSFTSFFFLSKNCRSRIIFGVGNHNFPHISGSDARINSLVDLF